MSRFVSWFTTKNGKRFTHGCVGAAAMVAFGNHIAIHGPLLEKLKVICQAYKRGEPRPLSPKMNSLVEEDNMGCCILGWQRANSLKYQVLHDCPLKQEQKEKVTFFYGVGHDLFHAGGIDSPWGAIIAIPFTFEDIHDVNFGELRIHGRETIDWVIDGQDLIKAMTISDSAKKFALMREIYSCDFTRILQNAVINAGCILIPARFAQIFNVKMRNFERLSFSGRSIFYSLCYAFGYVIYRCFKDPLKHIADKEADKIAAESGPDYLNGGIEYYKKMLLKHKALRELSGTQYEKMYNENGNENYFIFAPKLPVSKRLENLRDMKKEKTEKKTYQLQEKHHASKNVPKYLWVPEKNMEFV